LDCHSEEPGFESWCPLGGGLILVQWLCGKFDYFCHPTLPRLSPSGTCSRRTNKSHSWKERNLSQTHWAPAVNSHSLNDQLNDGWHLLGEECWQNTRFFRLLQMSPCCEMAECVK